MTGRHEHESDSKTSGIQYDLYRLYNSQTDVITSINHYRESQSCLHPALLAPLLPPRSLRRQPRVHSLSDPVRPHHHHSPPPADETRFPSQPPPYSSQHHRPVFAASSRPHPPRARGTHHRCHLRHRISLLPFASVFVRDSLMFSLQRLRAGLSGVPQMPLLLLPTGGKEVYQSEGAL